jgi:hypothetical protein
VNLGLIEQGDVVVRLLARLDERVGDARAARRGVDLLVADQALLLLDLEARHAGRVLLRRLEIHADVVRVEKRLDGAARRVGGAAAAGNADEAHRQQCERGTAPHRFPLQGAAPSAPVGGVG